MTTLPTDFDSFSAGVDLLSSDYSGGAGGTFTDLVSGDRDWTVNGATPTFETREGLEGVKFSRLLAERIHHDFYTQGEFTAVAIFEFDDALSNVVYGGTKTAANESNMFGNSHRIQAFLPSAGSGYTAAHTSGIAVVGAISFSPENNTAYATTYDGTFRKVSLATSLTGVMNVTKYWQYAVGQDRTTYLNGWVARVLTFHEALHYRDETALDDLILTEAAKVGL